MAVNMLICIEPMPRCVETSPGVFECQVWWSAAAAGRMLAGEYTVDPMLAELPGATNTRIEQDAKTKMQNAFGIAVDGRIHLFGGRTS